MVFRARDFLQKIGLGKSQVVYVGVHARRGDRLQAWKSDHTQLQDTIIGRYEGRFFNMAMDQLREEYNKDGQKVVFIATSDDFHWIKKHLVDKQDVFFPYELVPATRSPLPSNREVGDIWKDELLAVKGSKAWGTDLAILSMCNHTIVDYGTFGLWAGLLAGGRIIVPTGYSPVATPDMVWWENSQLENLQFVNVSKLSTKSY